MSHMPMLRALLGGAGLALCLVLLAAKGQAQSPATRPPILVTGRALPVQPDLFGTIALPVKASRYDERWERARRDASGSPQMIALIAPARALPRPQQIAFVQSAVHRRIRWMTDATEWGAQDYWASATETLAHGAGDMEDRAIVKMQALKALGVPERDLYVTLGRDRVAGPVAILVVRDGARFWMLDDSGGAPFTTDHRPDFEPSLTLGFGASWIHGRRYLPGARPRQAAAAAIAAR